MSKESEIIGVISARKYALFETIKTELLGKSELQGYDKEELQAKLRDAISTLPNMMFLSEEEKETNKIRQELKLEQIGIAEKEVFERISKYLSS
ncbi:hypothetical protein IX51_01795 [uncultured archaeon]|nr:hypothetical protein IX51_01795 [uncultured archaeon]